MKSDPNKFIDRTFMSHDDTSGEEGYACKDSSGRVEANTSATTVSLGIIVLGADAQDIPCTVAVAGIARAEVGTGNWTVGAELTANSDGLIATTTKGNYIVARALEAQTAASVGDCVLCLGARVGTYS